ncbi:hypothetical protein E3N88_17812 [Mikania micrantha]|uniref:Uncharacterized protein n=1 Tax=Mikania micrantha TaxID=192012 RepID=A0A5N6NSY0_9ASTR|nr:hypothetical protein E3N88_17812 [Mikania micrantha]
MPTFTTIALQNLLDHRTSGKNSSTLNNPQSSTEKPCYLPNQEQDELKSNARKSAGWRIDGSEVESDGNGGNGVQIDEKDDDFEDPGCDSSSVGSSSDLIDSSGLGFENVSVVSNQIGEFYDATEDFLLDGPISSVASCSSKIELELRTTRNNLLVEIEKRKSAEDDVGAMRTHWCRIIKFLLTHTSQAPASSSNNISLTTRFDINAVKQLSEEVVVVRFVAEAMGKAEAKAETELATQLIVTTKDREIARLRDRLQYYETMIHEMSQNNLESMEVARRNRERRRMQRKWLWCCIGMTVVIGTSVIAYSYAPQHHPLEKACDAHPEATYH